MKTSNKIIVVYLSVIITLSITCLCDNIVVAKRMEPLMVDLVKKIEDTDTRIHVVNMPESDIEENSNYSRLTYRHGKPYIRLGFAPTSNNIFIEGDTLNILTDEDLFIIFPYPVTAYISGEPSPVPEYIP